MIQADRAPVKPRVISPETGDAIPLEDLLVDAIGASGGIIEIVGGHGSGKTTALAHLAAIVPADTDVVYLDDEPLQSVVEAAGRAIVVFTSRFSRPLFRSVSYCLAPWGGDDLLEYLMTIHPLQCGSVLTRLRACLIGICQEGYRNYGESPWTEWPRTSR